jgi:ketosteroid isomerase-like protein
MIRYDSNFARGLACAASLASLAACAKPAPPAVDVAKETAALTAVDAALNDAAKAKDADKAVAYDADDIVSYGPGAAPITSKAADLAATKAEYADPAFSFTFTVDRTVVAASGDLAYQTGAFDQTLTNPDTKKAERTAGNWVATFKKASDGTWQLSAAAATPTLPPAAAPQAAAPPAAVPAPATNS